MATAVPQAQSAFHLQPADDDMEISSEFGRDQDIDIDLDVGDSYTPRPTDDDVMQDDVRSQGDQYTVQDDLMQDHSVDHFEDGVMADQNVDFVFEDEHLVDVNAFGDDGHDMNEEAGNDPADAVSQSFNYENAPEQSLTGQVDEHVFHTETEFNNDQQDQQDHSAQALETQAESGNVTISSPTQPDTGPNPLTKTSQPTHDEIVTTSTPPKTSASDHSEDHSQATNTRSSSQVEDTTITTKNEPESADSGSTVEQLQPHIQDENLQGQHGTHESWSTNQTEGAHDENSDNDDGHESFQDLHPVVVLYDNDKVSLFPPRNPDLPEQFFLQDETYAQKSLDELLRACRHVLGHTIGEDEDLELVISELDLKISENSTDDLSICFHDILDVYLDLHRHDGVDYPGPLHVTLVRSKRFASKFDSLRQAAKDGRGLSQLGISHYPTDGQENDEKDEDVSSEEDAEQEHSNASQHELENEAGEEDDEESSRASEYPPPNFYEEAEQYEHDKSEDDPSDSDDHSQYVTGQIEDANPTGLVGDEFINISAELTEDKLPYETNRNTEGEQAVPLSINDVVHTGESPTAAFGSLFDEPSIEVLQDDLVFYDEANDDAPVEESSTSSTLQGERSQQENYENPPSYNHEAHDAASPSGTVHDEDYITIPAPSDDNTHGSHIEGDKWLSTDAGEGTELVHHGNDDEPGPDSIQIGASEVENSYEAGEHASTTVAEGADDWQVFVGGDDYAEDNVDDAANYELDVSAPQPEPLPQDDVEDDGIDYQDHTFDQDTAFDQTTEGEARQKDSPLGKRTWDEQHDGLDDVFDEQDSKRVRAD